MASEGVLASNLVLQELVNDINYFQRTVETLFSELRNSIKAWVDDFGLYAKTEVALLDSLKLVLRILQKRGIHLSARKSEIFER